MGAESWTSSPKGLPREVAAEKDTKETLQWRGRTRRNEKGPDPGAGAGLGSSSQAPLPGSSLTSPSPCLLWFSDSILLETFRFPELGFYWKPSSSQSLGVPGVGPQWREEQE